MNLLASVVPHEVIGAEELGALDAAAVMEMLVAPVLPGANPSPGLNRAEADVTAQRRSGASHGQHPPERLRDFPAPSTSWPSTAAPAGTSSRPPWGTNRGGPPSWSPEPARPS
jgi:hypothetical protein